MNTQFAEFMPPDQEILQEVLVYFLDEVGEHLRFLRQGFQRVFSSGRDPELLIDLHHSVHTLKGSSSTVGLIHFSSYVRRLENAVHALQSTGLHLTTTLETALFATLDCLQEQIAAIQRDSQEDLNLQSTANVVFEQLENHLSGYIKDRHLAASGPKMDPVALAFSDDCQELLAEFEQQLHILQDSEVMAPLQMLLMQVKGLAQLFALASLEQICLCAERVLRKQVPTIALAQTILIEFQRACALICQQQETAILPSANFVALAHDENSLIQECQDLQRDQILQVMEKIRNNSSQICRINYQLKQLYHRLLSDTLEISDPGSNFQSVDLLTSLHFKNLQEMIAHLNEQVSGVSHLVERARENTSYLRENIDSLRKRPGRRMQTDHRERPNILIVDDSAAMRHMLLLSLRRMGFEGVEVACDGQEALVMLQLDNYRLVVSDIEMPRLNGFELLSHMQANVRLSRIPFIFLTSCASDQYRQLAHQMGATDYLCKPHRESDLRRSIAAAIGQEISA